MIVLKTKLKKIPEKCTKCTFSTNIADSNAFGFYTGTNTKYCSITHKKVPYIFDKEKNNWCYTKCKDCPLMEI